MKKLLLLLFIFFNTGNTQPPLQSVVRVVSTHVGFIGYASVILKPRGLPRRNGQIFNPVAISQHETSKT